MQLLQNHESLLPPVLKPALPAQDFKTIFSFLLSEIKKSDKSMFIPYFLPAASKFHLFVSGNPPVAQLRTNQVIKLEPLSHLSVTLDMHILNRSTHLVLHPNYKKGKVYFNSKFNTSVTSKHCFETLFLFNCSRQILQSPTGSALYKIHGLLKRVEY